MGVDSVGIFWAFLAGLVSFASPCVLPLIPGYLSFISGISVEEIQKQETGTWEIFTPSVVFVIGFSLVFVALGATASIIGSTLAANRLLLNRIAGVLIIFFGLVVMGVIKIPWLERQKGLRLRRPIGNLSVLFLGMAFAFAWTPCVGPILTSILLFAGTADNVRGGMLLLFIYSLGLGVPFIATGLALNKLIGAFSWIKRHNRLISILSGLLLIVMGILLATNQFTYFGNILRTLPSPTNWLPSL